MLLPFGNVTRADVTLYVAQQANANPVFAASAAVLTTLCVALVYGAYCFLRQQRQLQADVYGESEQEHEMLRIHAARKHKRNAFYSALHRISGISGIEKRYEYELYQMNRSLSRVW